MELNLKNRFMNFQDVMNRFPAWS